MPRDIDPGPALQRLLLGDQLRALRVGRSLSAEDVTGQLGWYRAKLGKIESGTMRATTADIDALLTLYGVRGRPAAEVRDLAKDARRKTPPARVADFAKQYVALWNTADEMYLFSADHIPGPFQQTPYARAILATSVTVPPSEIDRIAQARADRIARVVAPGGPQVWIILGEEAFLRQIGGRQVLYDQLVHLRDLAARPNIELQVIPLATGAHVAVGSRFNLLNFTAANTSFAYVEGLTTADGLKGHHARTYSLVFDRLRATASTPQESLALLDRHISQLAKE
jgi:transcriptional regulator with XRE-family HTH domain